MRKNPRVSEEGEALNNWIYVRKIFEDSVCK